MISKAPDLLLSNLTSIHSLSNKLKHQKCKCYLLLGRTFRLTSELATQLRKTTATIPQQDEAEESRLLEIHGMLSRWSDTLIDVYKSVLMQILTSDADAATAASTIAQSRTKLKSMRSTSNVLTGGGGAAESQLIDTAASVVGLEVFPNVDRADFMANPNLTYHLNLIKVLLDYLY